VLRSKDEDLPKELVSRASNNGSSDPRESGEVIGINADRGMMPGGGPFRESFGYCEHLKHGDIIHQSRCERKNLILREKRGIWPPVFKRECV